MTVTAALVKELRERTGAGMMECKKALMESDGDVELAIENMRIAGRTMAAKKAGNVAAEGIILIRSNDAGASLVEVNCQTDFVAKHASFKAFANSVADAAIADSLDIDALKTKFEMERKALIGKIGENIEVRCVTYIEGEISATYLSGERIGAVIVGEGNKRVLQEICRQVCICNPQFVSPSDIPEDVIAKEEKILIEMYMNQGKPEAIAKKIVTQRMKEFARKVALKAQPSLSDPNKSVAEVLEEARSNVKSFVRLEVGEGIEKQEELSFAEEVAKVIAEDTN